MSTNKAELRRLLLQQRQAMSKEQWREKSTRLCQHLARLPVFTSAKTVLAYFSFRQEPDVSCLFTSDRQWGFPRCVDASLVWHSWEFNQALQKNAYGILEPLSSAPILLPEMVDLIVVPAVACDARGYRLGYGGGYYDRLLSSPLWAAKPTVGVIFDEAFLPQLPANFWDKQLSAICTESGFKMLHQARGKGEG